MRHNKPPSRPALAMSQVHIISAHKDNPVPVLINQLRALAQAIEDAGPDLTEDPTVGYGIHNADGSQVTATITHYIAPS